MVTVRLNFWGVFIFMLLSFCIRVRTGPGNLESPGILFWHFPGLESPGKGSLVLESSGNVLNSIKKYERLLMQVRP